MKIYISLPIRGMKIGERRQYADRVKARLSRDGHEVVNPLDIYAGKNPTYNDHIAYDLRAMMDCDAILFCKGWNLSCGCNIERDTALRYIQFGIKDFKLMYE